MEFDGWLIKVNGIEFPTSLIALNTYKSTPNQESDMDSYTDADGLLHRNILPHHSTKIEFNTVPMPLLNKMKIRKLIPIRTRLSLEYWNDETNSYTSGDFYVPDIIFEINRINKVGKNIFYNPIRIAFIEY